MKKIDRVINNLKEMMVANAPGESTGMTSSAPSEGPNAGFDTFLNSIRKRRNNQIDFRSVPQKYRKWIIGNSKYLG